MRLCRFNNDRLGSVEGDVVRDVTAALDVLPEVRWPLPAGDPLVAHLVQIQERIKRIAAEAPKHKLADIHLLSPVANPGKIMAAPANYRLHVEMDTKDPTIDAGVHRAQLIDMEAPTEKLGLFLKANSSLVGPSQGIVIPHHAKRLDYEVELCCGYRSPGARHPQVGRSILRCRLLHRLGHDRPRRRRSELQKIER